MCPKSFKAQKYIAQHYDYVHLKQRIEERKCPKCNIKVPASARAFHLEEVHGIPAPKCGICNKKFPFHNRLWLHQRSTHMREKNVLCKICGKQFFDNHGLKRHMATHAKERPFFCKVCSKRFNWKSNLDVHVRIHTGEKPHVCKVCGAAFIESRGLKCHIAKHHP